MKLGVIGFGSRIRDVIRTIQRVEPDCRVAAVADIRREALQRDAAALGLEAAVFYDTPEEMLAAGGIDGVMVGTRCSLHTEMALKVLPTGLPLYLEKPVATTMDDLLRLKAGREAYPQVPAVVSFPLRVTSIVETVKEIVGSGRLGTIEHVQAVNNVPYGGVYYHNWYRDEDETGGLFLQKATHDFDYIHAVLGLEPVQVAAMTSKQVFKGDKPAGLTCAVCEDNRTCEESTAFATDETVRDHWTHCCFAADTGNEDSGSALIRYESGMHVSYSQNFFARRGAAARGARFLGYKGTLEFDFYTAQIKVFMHHTGRTETYDIDPGEAHFGGDARLAASFLELMRTPSARSVSPLEAGLTSALLCLKARESAATGAFRAVAW